MVINKLYFIVFSFYINPICSATVSSVDLIRPFGDAETDNLFKTTIGNFSSSLSGLSLRFHKALPVGQLLGKNHLPK